jgi:Recombination endonuclease VII
MVSEQKFVKGEDGSYNESKRRRYNEWKASGLCVCCGNHPKSDTSLRCQKCRSTKEQHHRHKLKMYGITPEQYDSLLIHQNFNCEICKEYLQDPCVDPDHETGAIRGIICRKCNTALGMIGDSLTRIENIITYLKKYKYDS